MPYPPQFAEDFVALFLPPACRDEVLGDLCERYSNAGQYAANALAVTPRVILSQIRRNTDSMVFLLTVCAICYSFATGIMDFSLQGDPLTLVRLSIPTIAALLVLLVRNGYAEAESRRQRAITLDVAMAMGMAAMTQLVLRATFHSNLTLHHWLPAQGPACGWLFVIVLRAWFPPEMRVPRQVRRIN